MPMNATWPNETMPLLPMNVWIDGVDTSALGVITSDIPELRDAADVDRFGGYLDALLGGGRHVHVVHADAGTADDGLVDGLVGELLALRAGAREQRDFATADRIRERLLKLGVEIEDTRDGTRWLLANLLYGAGLRLLEACTLRVKDVDLGQRQLVVRGGKGARDRVTLLPDLLVEPLTKHLAKTSAAHQRDLGAGCGRAIVEHVPIPPRASRVGSTPGGHA